ncbi:MAG TPA: hypothetical protein VF790_06295 [Dissulfurispiraceae bacterium]
MWIFVKNGAVIVFAFTVAAFVSACGTTKNFVVDSNLKGTLIVLQPKEGFPYVKGQGIYRDTPLGEAPLTTPVTFINDTTKANFIAEKRGYTSSAIAVDKNSAEAISFDLKKINGVSEAAFKKEDLLLKRYLLLPAFVEVHVRSGVGALGKLEYSPEASKKVADELDTELAKALGSGKDIRLLASFDEPMKNNWQKLSADLNKYLLKLDAKRLSYYSFPPLIAGNVEGFKVIMENLGDRTEGDGQYLIYLWCKCITETKGRKVGNIALAIFGAAAQGASRAAYGVSIPYNPSAFNPDSGTLVAMYVIDAKTSEVLYIDHRVLSDITDPDALKSMVSGIASFPNTDKKKEGSD